MSEMVDRVTAAICRAERDWLESDRKISLQEATAIAAIKELRDPTDAMEKAGAVKWDDDWCTETNALNMWQAMCDQALK